MTWYSSVMNDNAGRLAHLFTSDKWDETPDGCWNWKKTYKSNGGYGNITGRKGGKSISSPASRVSLRIKLGRPLQEGYFACHTCDNPACVNPDHLYEGTPRENTQDMIRRGRRNDSHLKGGLATRKLTKEQTDEIRARVQLGEYQAQLAKEFGVSASVVSEIVNGVKYGYDSPVPHKKARARRGLADEEVRSIRQRVQSGETQASIEKGLGLSRGTVSRIVTGRLYRDVE